eukprot:SAG31_NODE_17770_length_658_cov_1.194991_1_plen_207_part_00
MLLSGFCATTREIRDFNREKYGTNRESVTLQWCCTRTTTSSSGMSSSSPVPLLLCFFASLLLCFFASLLLLGPRPQAARSGRTRRMEEKQGYRLNATCDGCLSSGRWTLLTFVRSSNVLKIYIDGLPFEQVRSYFLVSVPTIREIRDFYREMQRTNRESITMYRHPSCRRRREPTKLTFAGRHIMCLRRTRTSKVGLMTSGSTTLL